MKDRKGEIFISRNKMGVEMWQDKVLKVGDKSERQKFVDLV